nr:hypothetical protein GCM10025699_26930 [Microbacterium flavescens]
MSTRTVLHQADIARALTRISHEILESNRGPDNLVLLGIPTRGVTLAHRIAGLVEDFGGVSIPVGALDVTMYRDDLHRNPTRAPQPTSIPPGGIDGRVVVLVDDVLFSGRSIRAALDALQDIGGRPPCDLPRWSTAVTASCPSDPTSSGRTSPAPATSA